MSSKSDSSSINSEDYEEIEREIDKCAKVLEELDRKRTMKEQKNKLIEVRKEIERQLKKEDNRSKNRMEIITEKIKQIEERKNKIIGRKRRGPILRHQDETMNSSDESAGEIKIEIDIKEEI